MVERAASDDIKLFQVTDSSGELVTQEVEAPGGNLTGDLLEVSRRMIVVDGRGGEGTAWQVDSILLT